MHRHFLRLLISIVGVTILVITMQLTISFLFRMNLVSKWRDAVFDEFATSISEKIDSGAYSLNDDGLFDIAIEGANERISGFVIRDRDGKFVLSFGRTPHGKPMEFMDRDKERELREQVKSSQIVGYNNSSDGGMDTVVYKIDQPKYELSVKRLQSVDSEASISFRRLNNSGSSLVEYPAKMDRSDVAGTVLISVNGIPSGYLDVFVFNVDYYNPTKYILREYGKAIISTIPIAVIVSLILAYFISRKNSKMIKEYVKALNSLSNGEFDIALPETKIVEFQAISSSINKLSRDLQRHSSSRKEWIRNISHDLNTPLTSINLLLDGAKDGLFPLDKELINQLKSENDVLIARIASVGYFSYLLSPDFKPSLVEFRVSDAVDEVLQSIDGENIKVNADLDINIVADYEAIKRALKEVVENAERYKRGDGECSISVFKKDGSVVISVSNPGELPKPRPNFFEPWARGDESRSSGGSGMGLSIVYQIIQIHGGRIDIYEENGRVTVALIFKCNN